LKKSGLVSAAEKYASEIEIFTFGRGFQAQISRSSVQKRRFHWSMTRQFWMADFFNRIGRLLPFAAYATGVILYRIRTSMRQVNDSGAFKEALGAWLPLVHQRHATLRAIKRFINRIRYLAMLQQGEQLDHSFLEELHLHQAPNPQTTRSQAIAEHRLVALGALHDLYEDDWRKNVEAENYPPDIAKAINNYQNRTSAGWPPGKEELDAFESSLRGVRVAGEVDILPSNRGRERSERPEESTERK
jgi:hypothetical protein